MQWRGRRESRNVEDRRGLTTAGAGGMGVVGVLVVLAVGYFFGIDISPIIGAMDQGQQTGETRELTPEEQEIGQFVSVVLADTEEVWSRVLPEQAGVQYVDPTLVMFSGAVQSACGGASAAMGPFYCPNDQKLYLDTDFFTIMQKKMGAGGDFAYAYVVAHEVGHHVQNLLGVLGETMKLRQQVGEADANRISVLTELQADCFAGVWGKNASEQFGTIEDGDIEEALNAASAVGDDTLMQQAGRAVRPESFTHGSAQDRMTWFKRGFDSGQIAQCNTFKEAGL
ncbi:MAG TPA: neutral zinc metallopeptidase [Paracoccus sp. (in: a-proteobacteria)]|uniref:KPN_02809 family neutral zinc metallopeptidase n=1 Tax=Paracoccus sp. TaxID=267 RepID=UPI002BB2DCC2|nr:neutral zinc metallopeptidase [Paracoccus sp. (in: a-proteobacteria)]HWL56907.1 neutral zinc metallopeptidase [Paracoccus sp. (in: a-proteobacteria)]